MRKNLYEQVLNALLTNGIGYQTDVSHLFVDFAKNVDLTDVYWTDRIQLIDEYLESMLSNKHIHYFKTKKQPRESSQINEHWLDPVQVIASISYTGAEYIVNRNNFDATLVQLSNSVKSRKSTRNWAIVAIIISIISLFKEKILPTNSQYQSPQIRCITSESCR